MDSQRQTVKDFMQTEKPKDGKGDRGMDSQRRTVKDFMQKHIVLFLIIMLLCVFLNNIVTSAVTAPFKSSVAGASFLTALCKYVTALIPLFLMVKWNLIQKSSPRRVLTGLLLGIPSLLFVVENLLPFTLIGPASYKVQWLSVLAIVIAYFGVGLMEEAGCRGVLLPLLCEKWSDRKNGHMAAALFSSALFACAHLSWIVGALLRGEPISMAEYMGRLYQMYYAFCFGMLCAGVTLCAKSIIPMVVWHSLIDISAFIGQGILFPTTYQYYFELNPVGFAAILTKKGILPDVWIVSRLLPVVLDTVLLVVGIILVRRSKRCKQPV